MGKAVEVARPFLGIPLPVPVKKPRLSLFHFVGRSVSVTLRLEEIAWLLARYGLLGSLTEMGFEIGKRGILWTQNKKGSGRTLDSLFGKRLAITFSKLGPTFIKLGQVLATREDIVGTDVAAELKVLFDRVEPLPFRRIQYVLKKELGKKRVEKEFREIHSKALASASLSQTHEATLTDGTPVILKVQKDDVEKLVRVDLWILEGIAKSIQLASPKFQVWQMFQDFRDGTVRELDYLEEAKNIDQFRKNYRRFLVDSNVVFPRYFPHLTTRKVITLEPLHGKKLSELRKGSTVAKSAANQSVTAVLEQIFDHGFFHADPHAGNLFFLEDSGRLGFIDLGLVGTLKLKDKRKFLQVLLSVLRKDRKALAASLFALGEPSPDTNYSKFEKDIDKLIDQLKHKAKNQWRLDEVMQEVLRVAQENRIFIPNRYFLMMRSCLMVEGVAKSLDPSISMADIAAPIVLKSLMKSYDPLRIVKNGIFRLLP